MEADVPTRQSAHPFDPLGLAERHNVEESEWYPGAQAAHARWALLTELGRSHTGVLKEYAEHMFQDCSLLTPETSEGKVPAHRSTRLVRRSPSPPQRGHGQGRIRMAVHRGSTPLPPAWKRNLQSGKPCRAVFGT